MATTKKPKSTWSDKYLANQPDFFVSYGGPAVVDGDALLLVIGGVTVQRLTRADDQTVRDELLLTASALAELEGRASHYTAGVLPGFISIKTGRDPRPALEANLGSATGAAIFEVNQTGAAAAKGAAERVASFLAASPAKAKGKSAASAAGWKKGAWKTLLRGARAASS